MYRFWEELGRFFRGVGLKLEVEISRVEIGSSRGFGLGLDRVEEVGVWRVVWLVGLWVLGFVR